MFYLHVRTFYISLFRKRLTGFIKADREEQMNTTLHSVY